MKTLRKLWDAISYPFIAISVLIGEDREQNLDGYYNEYWGRKNRKKERKEKKHDNAENESL